jgi:hypothetical protein
MRRSRAGTNKMSRTAALPAMWIALLSPGPETPVGEAAIPYGTSAARPKIAPAAATRPHHGFDLNTPHAARVNNARLTSAPTLASVHAAPPGGFLVPDEAMTSDTTPHSARAEGDGWDGWTVTWLPGRVLTRN